MLTIRTGRGLIQVWMSGRQSAISQQSGSGQGISPQRALNAQCAYTNMHTHQKLCTGWKSILFIYWFLLNADADKGRVSVFFSFLKVAEVFCIR